ncbi:MAG: hypothetical protein WC022_00610 [Parcubacteria group bacterium]
MRKGTFFAVILAVFMSIVNCNASDGNCIKGLGTAIGNGEINTVPVYVVTKGEFNAPLKGEGMEVPLGQYIVGKDGKLVNVTGKSMRGIFEAGLASYGIKESGSILNVNRCLEGSNLIIYVFDYRK